MKLKITHWKEADNRYLGYLNEYPDHWTQGENLDDLKEHCRDLHQEFSQGDLLGILTVN